MKEKEIGSLQHTTWRCQYHVVFAPKYRRMAIYGQIRKDIGQIQNIAEWQYTDRSEKISDKYFGSCVNKREWKS